MEALTINGTTRNIRYVHHRIKDHKKGGVKSYGGVTRCTVNLGTSEVPEIIEGSTKCHSKELFYKPMGRVISKGRLVQELRLRGMEVSE